MTLIRAIDFEINHGDIMQESNCEIKRLALKFVQMAEHDMHLVYSIVKDQPFMTEAYERAKEIREKIKKERGLK